MTGSELYRLSPAQRRAWLRAGGEGTRVLAARARVTGLTQTALDSAVAAVAARHEAARLRFVEHPELRTPLQAVDDGHAGPVAALPVPPLTVTLAGDQLVISGSELVLDPASLAVLLSDLARAVNGTLAAAAEPLQFLDVSEWHHEQLDQAGTRLADPLTGIELPFPPEGGRTGYGEHRVRLPTEVVGRLAQEARRPAPADTAVAAMVVAALALALSRYGPSTASGPDDPEDAGDPDAASGPVVAWYGAGRAAPDTGQVVGPLGYYVPLALGVPGAGLGAFVDRVADRIAVAAGAQHLAEPLDPAAAAAGGCGVAVVAGVDLARLTALGATSVSIDPPEPVGGLHLGGELTAAGLELTLRHDLARYADDSASRLLDAVVAILESLPGALAGTGELRLTGAAETALLERWGTGDPLPRSERTLVDVLDAGLRAASRRAGPAAAAVIAADGELTFAELDAAGNSFATYLSARGVTAGDRVAVLGQRSWRTVAAFLGVLRAGAVYVPVDPTGSVMRIASLARRAQAALVVGPPARRDLLAALAAEFAVVTFDDADGAGAAQMDDGRGPRIGQDQAAYIIFTSGSTGAPQPVVVEHGSVARLFDALAATVYPAEPGSLRVAVNAPFTFDASMKQLIQLGAGHTLCLIPEAVREGGTDLLRYLAEQRVDVLDGTPSHLRVLLEAVAAGQASGLPRLLLVGGEPIDARLWSELAALPGTRAVNLYGPTECTVDATAAEITAASPPSIGAPLPGVRVSILDERGRPVPAGVPGELHVTGRQVARGILGDAEATAARFTGEGAGRCYRTGDRARFRADGQVEYLGRADGQVKIRGFRVEPAEVEAALLEHPAVAQAVVVARDGQLAGYVTGPAGRPRVDLARLAGINPHETRYLFDEIFTRRTYLRGGVTLREDAVVLDVGANIGMFSLFASELAPRGTIYAFEPVASVFDVLRRNLADYAVPARLFDHGLSDVEREVSFTCYPGYSMMSGQREYADTASEVEVIKRYLSNERDAGATDSAALLARVDELLDGRFRDIEQRVRLRRLSDVLDKEGVDRVDLLKIDVQRAELDVLRGLDERHWPLIGQIAMEVHDAIGTATQGRVDIIVAMLEDHGFEVVVEQEAALAGTDRFALYAVRPGYPGDPRGRAGRVDGPTLREWLAGRLPAHLVPDAIVVLDTLPVTVNGKIDRGALPALGRADQPGGPPGAGPASPAEAILLQVWQEVLGIAQISVDDNFFTLGGDSIRSIQAQVAAARRGLTFPLREIFVYQTIRELVRDGHVEVAGAGDSGDAEPPAQAQTAPAGAFTLVRPSTREQLAAGLDDAYPMTTLQLGMVFHTELTGDPATYHNVTAHLLDAPLDAGALRAALAALAAAHPILRTAFDLGGYDEPLQLVHQSVLVPVLTQDLRGQAQPDQEMALDQAIHAELREPFDWHMPPLVRFRALRVADDRFWLLVSEHHAVLDGWSLHLLLTQLRDRYGQLLRGREPDPPPPAMPYRRFVELERTARADDGAQAFWRRRLAGARPLLMREPDAGRRCDPPRITRMLDAALPDGLGSDLARAAAAAGVPLKSLLLAVHLRALGELAGRDDVMSGLVVSGRPGEPGGDATLGLFLNVLPITARLGTRPVGELASEAWRAEQELMGHHLVPLADIERNAGSGPLFDTFFNYTRFHEVPGGANCAITVLSSRGIPVDVALMLAVDFESDPAAGVLSLYFQYDKRQLSGQRVADLGGRYRDLLASAAALDAGPLPALLAAPNPPPADPWAARVSDAWRELVGAPPQAGGADFFAAGGTSLLALRLTAVLRDRFGAAIALPDFTREPTFAALVGLCRGDTVTRT